MTYSQVQAGAYALILKEENGKRRVPIIIGTPEAQSIAIFLEGLKPPRPLTHDLFMAFAKAVNVQLRSVDIYKYEDGVFFSALVFDNNNADEKLRIDSRTSDAIALAIRTNAPIYISESILQEVGVEMEDEDFFDETEKPKDKVTYADLNVEELQKLLNDAITAEDYEKASRLRDIIKNK
jgi:bifunctional DNase/RNase